MPLEATNEAAGLQLLLLEQSVGDLAPRDALAPAGSMIAERRVLPLEGGLMTTLAVRAREEASERRFTTLAQGTPRDVGDAARTIASGQLAERIGGKFTPEQTHALSVITGTERVLAPSRQHAIAGLARTPLHHLVRAPDRTQERAR